MKSLLLVIATIALASAVQVQQHQQQQNQQNAGTGGNVGTGTSGSQLHQCTCDDQYKGFREFKDYATQCFDQCRTRPNSVIPTLMDSPVKVYPCLDQKVNMIHRMFDCVNGKLNQAESCISETNGGTGGQTQFSGEQDFRTQFVNHVDPLFDQLVNALGVLDQQSNQQNSQQKYATNVVGFGTCAPDCLINKIKQSSYFEQANCLPKISENQLQQYVQTCFNQMNVRQTFYQICMCAVGVGVTQLQQSCQQLAYVKFPQFAQGVFNGGMQQGFSNDFQQQSGQFGQQQNSFGQKLLVKLAIQQEEQPNYQGSSGFNQGQGSFGGSQGGYVSGGQQGYQGYPSGQGSQRYTTGGVGQQGYQGGNQGTGGRFQTSNTGFL